MPASTKKKQILFICSAKNWGGNEKWTAMAMAGLMKSHDVFFLGAHQGPLEMFGTVTRSFRAPFKSIFDLRTLKTIQDIVIDHNIDVIVSTKRMEYFLAGLVAKKLKVRHVLRLGIVRDMKYPFWSKLVYFKLNNGIIVNADRIKQNLRKYPYFEKHPIATIYNGIIGNPPTGSIQRGNGIFTIVSTGMLTQRKGFHILIEAISMLPESERKKVQLYILGEGPKKESLAKLIHDLKLDGHITIAGFCKNTVDYLQQTDLFTLISDNEGISNAVIEAMYYGVPVMSTEAGGASEFIENGINGYLIERDARSIADLLQELMNSEKRNLAAVGKKGQSTVAALFNMEKMNRDIEKFLFQELGASRYASSPSADPIP